MIWKRLELLKLMVKLHDVGPRGSSLHAARAPRVVHCALWGLSLTLTSKYTTTVLTNAAPVPEYGAPKNE
jgi:hypothetical protein